MHFPFRSDTHRIKLPSMRDEPLSPRDEQRRQLLLALLAMGAFSSASRSGPLLGAQPGAMPDGKSIYLLEGAVQVNGTAATKETHIPAGALVETGADSKVIFRVDKDAFIMRSDSRLQLEGEDDVVVETLRLITGRLLSVFGRRRHTMHTSTATIGIRGTGVYVESEPERSYVCTCYGVTDIVSASDQNARETIDSKHHDAPRYVIAGGGGDALIQPAPFINHTDEELLLIETLVGREPPFAVDPSYDRPRPRVY